MRRLRGPAGLHPGLFRRPVATIGTFDGVHLGHRAVLQQTADLASDLGEEPVVVTFDVHPRVVVSGRGPVSLLTEEHRLRLLEEAGMAATVVLHFDEVLRSMEAAEFLESILVRSMGVVGLVLGPDSHYGRDRRGDVTLARTVLDPLAVAVRAVEPVLVDGALVSSTSLREAVRAGDLAGARAMAGRRWSVLATVVRGDGRGRSLGFPTANLDLAGVARPPRGVWIARAILESGDSYPCLVNIGGRPTFHPEGSTVDTVEAWLDGFDGDLYGSRLELRFLASLREERKFSGPEALRQQIARDRVAMVEFFARNRFGDDV
jgi:riboflavin kinase/FMN adenylyltransferase